MEMVGSVYKSLFEYCELGLLILSLDLTSLDSATALFAAVRDNSVSTTCFN